MGGPLTKDCALFGAGKSKHEEGYCLRSLFFVIVRQCIKGASLKPGHLPHTGSFERRSLVKRAVKNRMEFALVFPRCELLPERFYKSALHVTWENTCRLHQGNRGSGLFDSSQHFARWAGKLARRSQELEGLRQSRAACPGCERQHRQRRKDLDDSANPHEKSLVLSIKR